MSETPWPLAPELGTMVLAPDLASLLEQAAVLRLENAALHAQNTVLHERIREVEWTRRNDEKELSDALAELQRVRARSQ